MTKQLMLGARVLLPTIDRGLQLIVVIGIEIECLGRRERDHGFENQGVRNRRAMRILRLRVRVVSSPKLLLRRMPMDKRGWRTIDVLAQCGRAGRKLAGPGEAREEVQDPL